MISHLVTYGIGGTCWSLSNVSTFQLAFFIAPVNINYHFIKPFLVKQLVNSWKWKSIPCNLLLVCSQWVSKSINIKGTSSIPFSTKKFKKENKQCFQECRLKWLNWPKIKIKSSSKSDILQCNQIKRNTEWLAKGPRWLSDSFETIQFSIASEMIFDRKAKIGINCDIKSGVKKWKHRN